MNKKQVVIVSGILIIMVAAFAVYFFFLKSDKKTYNEAIKVKKSLENFKIYTPSSNVLVVKEVYMQKEISDTKNIEKVLESFLNELPSPLKETRVLGIYRDKDNEIYIDLSKNFASPQSVQEEYLLLKAVYKTLKENFPWMSDIKILIEGKDIESLSGHFSIELSLKEVMEEKL